jgi:hypothetical protein
VKLVNKFDMTPICEAEMAYYGFDGKKAETSPVTKIYRIWRQIPKFGIFKEEAVCLPVGNGINLILGADWMRRN